MGNKGDQCQRFSIRGCYVHEHKASFPRFMQTPTFTQLALQPTLKGSYQEGQPTQIQSDHLLPKLGMFTGMPLSPTAKGSAHLSNTLITIHSCPMGKVLGSWLVTPVLSTKRRRGRNKRKGKKDHMLFLSQRVCPSTQLKPLKNQTKGQRISELSLLLALIKQATQGQGLTC